MEKRIIDSFEEAEQYLNDMPRFTSKHTINETRAFLNKMGSPDKKMKILHIAGTNGKGSTCAYLASVLKRAGIRAGLFTSPHLINICERFAINGRIISKECFLEAFLRIYESLDWEALKKDEGYHPTYFEYLFFMAMDIFARENITWCILETGLGGLLDATNSVADKEAAVIARIGLDHMEYLGNSIEEIAGQKAGIISPGRPVIYNDYVSAASLTIKDEAKRLGASDIIPVGDSFIKRVPNDNGKTVDFLVLDGYYKGVVVALDTVAEYQLQNAGLAIKAIEATSLRELINPAVLKEGLEKCHWSGRMEQVLPEVFLDGAHNPDGIEAFIRTLLEDKHEGTRCLLFGVVADKNYEAMIDELVGSGLFEKILIAPLHTSRSAQISALTEIFSAYDNVTFAVAADPVSGLKELLSSQSEGQRIYVTGSLYLVGEIMKYCLTI